MSQSRRGRVDSAMAKQTRPPKMAQAGSTAAHQRDTKVAASHKWKTNEAPDRAAKGQGDGMFRPPAYTSTRYLDGYTKPGQSKAVAVGFHNGYVAGKEDSWDVTAEQHRLHVAKDILCALVARMEPIPVPQTAAQLALIDSRMDMRIAVALRTADMLLDKAGPLTVKRATR